MQKYDLFFNSQNIWRFFFRFGLFHLLYTQNRQNLFVYAGYMTDREKLKEFFEKKSVSNKKKLLVYLPRRR